MADSSCALRTGFLKCCQLCTIHLNLRAGSQGISSNSSLNNLKFTLLRLRVLTLLFAMPIFLETMNSTRTWLLQPEVLPILTSLVGLSAPVSTKFRNAFPLLSLSNTWIGKLFSMHSWITCSSLCCFPSRHLGGWNLPWGWKPANVILLVVEVRRPHPNL